MSGRSSRQRGHRWERLLASTLSAALSLDIRTGRSLGHSYGADLVTVTGYDAHGRAVSHTPAVLGFSVEAKDVKARCPKAWLRQAREQMVFGLTPVVLWNRRNFAFEKGSAFLESEEKPGWVEVPIMEWVAQCQDLRFQSTSVPDSHSKIAPSQ